MSKLLGIDPGFASLGWALVELLPETERVIQMGVIRTAKSTKKRSVRASDDNLRRIGELTQSLEPMVYTPGAIAVCAESQSWPRNAGSSAKVGMAWGVLGALAAIRGVPIFQASPQEVKKAVTGKKTASKLEVQIALEVRYGPLKWPPQKTLREHAADALASVVACLDAPGIQVVRRQAAQPPADEVR
jgi:crossover junction endodeoxyribonuclease RuvC